MADSLLQQHLRMILERNYQIKSDQFVLLVYDRRCWLSNLLADAYNVVLASYPHQSIDFDRVQEDAILPSFAALPAHSLVILVQSTSFRLTKHRLRADLFRNGHQVIEHARLAYNRDDQIANYIDSLQYDTPFYCRFSDLIEQRLVENHFLRIESGDNLLLEVQSAFEKSIKNTGHFSNGQIASTGFPIGEIFTEAKELDKMNGEVLVFGFPTTEHKTFFCKPFIVRIKEGCVIDHQGPLEFETIVQLIKAGEINQKVQVREIGFGLNRGIGFEKRLDEPTAFERFAGMHFSLGLKHAMYGKKLGRKVFQKYHIDIFCLVKKVFIGETLIFNDGEYVI